MLVEILIFIITFLIVYFIYAHRKITKHFDNNGLKYLPGIPVFGNAWKSTLVRQHIVEDIIDVYNAFPDEKYVGYIESTLSIIIIRDPEIIKNITVKDFDHFVDHRDFFPENDPLFGSSVFGMKGERWRNMRMTLSPAFTGSKMRLMLPFMAEVSQNVVQYLKENINSDIQLDDVMRRYTNDVIASAGFGLQVNSFSDKNNDFYAIGQNLFNFSFVTRIKFFILAAFPGLAEKFDIQLFPKKTQDFFKDIVVNTIDFRKKNKVERPDMIQLLMEASAGTLKFETEKEADNVGFATVNEAWKPPTQGNGKNFSLNDLIGQVFIFFSAGFETSAGALILCIHELALHPEIEEKLYQEIKVFKEKRGDVNYDNINELSYLDAVLNETFRKWSGAIILDRVCTRTYELPPLRPGAKPYTVKPGDIVYNMVNAIHLDPKYYPDPHKFDPERFSNENKHKIKPFTFQPFGLGPRNCIGSRFAILEIKILLYHLILNFRILKSAKTMDPIKLDPREFNIKVKGGSWVRMEERN